MGKAIHYTDAFKQEAVNQVEVHGYSVLEVSSSVIIPVLGHWNKSSRRKTSFNRDIAGNFFKSEQKFRAVVVDHQ